MEFQRRSELSPMLVRLDKCVALYTQEDWTHIEQQLAAAPQMQSHVLAMQRFLFSGTIESPIDKQGRVVVPPAMRQYAALDREVVIAGVGPRVEIWDKARFEREIEETQVRFPEIADAVSQMGSRS